MRVLLTVLAAVHLLGGVVGGQAILYTQQEVVREKPEPGPIPTVFVIGKSAETTGSGGVHLTFNEVRLEADEAGKPTIANPAGLLKQATALGTITEATNREINVRFFVHLRNDEGGRRVLLRSFNYNASTPFTAECPQIECREGTSPLELFPSDITSGRRWAGFTEISDYNTDGNHCSLVFMRGRHERDGGNKPFAKMAIITISMDSDGKVSAKLAQKEEKPDTGDAPTWFSAPTNSANFGQKLKSWDVKAFTWAEVRSDVKLEGQSAEIHLSPSVTEATTIRGLIPKASVMVQKEQKRVVVYFAPPDIAEKSVEVDATPDEMAIWSAMLPPHKK